MALWAVTHAAQHRCKVHKNSSVRTAQCLVHGPLSSGLFIAFSSRLHRLEVNSFYYYYYKILISFVDCALVCYNYPGSCKDLWIFIVSRGYILLVLTKWRLVFFCFWIFINYSDWNNVRVWVTVNYLFSCLRAEVVSWYFCFTFIWHRCAWSNSLRRLDVNYFHEWFISPLSG